MKKFAFLLFIIHCSMHIIKADWVAVNNGITQLNINALTATGNYIFAGTNVTINGGGVFVSTNNGTNWSQAGIFNTTLALASNLNYIYAGYQNGLRYSTNYGANWSFGNFGSTQWVTSILANGNYVYAGCFYPLHNTNNRVWVSTDYGANWTQTPLNNKDHYAFTMSGNYLFAGGDGLYVSTNNGANWSLSILTGPWALASHENFIYAGIDGSPYGVYVSQSYGANWFLTNLNVGTHALAAYGNNIFAGTGGGIYVSNDNGSNWFYRNEGMGGAYWINTLCISNVYIFAGTDGD